MSATSRFDQMTPEDQELAYALSALTPLLSTETKQEYAHLIDSDHDEHLSERITKWKRAYSEH